jgi:hypothetical protein
MRSSARVPSRGATSVSTLLKRPIPVDGFALRFGYNPSPGHDQWPAQARSAVATIRLSESTLAPQQWTPNPGRIIIFIKMECYGQVKARPGAVGPCCNSSSCPAPSMRVKCRMLLSLCIGMVTSKPAVARWKNEATGTRWGGSVQSAAARPDEAGSASEHRVEDMLALIDFVAGEYQQWISQR